MRTIVDFEEPQIKALDAWAKRRRISRAEAVRLAVNRLLREQPSREKGFGLWSGAKVDGLKEQRALRREWDDE